MPQLGQARVEVGEGVVRLRRTTVEGYPAMRHQKVSSLIRARAREMRSHPIDVERDLWSRLRSRKLSGLKFRRQQPMGGYIADFVCLEARLIIEIGGKQHQGDRSDLARSEKL